VGGLVRLHARGVAELRRRTEQGETFDQGDLDLRWSRALGLAVSLSKLGDRWVWMGSDASRWWVFELKSEPSRLRTGPLHGSSASVAMAFPWVLGLRPLQPRDGAPVERTEGGWRVVVETPRNELPVGAELVAEFDARTLLVRATELRLAGGEVWRAQLDSWMSVESLGLAEGAWPRVPRRVDVRSGAKAEWTAVRVSLDRADASEAATDRPGLYDLEKLRAQFAPEVVETLP
jgi:hypothetical protein